MKPLSHLNLFWNSRKNKLLFFPFFFWRLVSYVHHLFSSPKDLDTSLKTPNKTVLGFQGLWFKGFFCITEIFSYYSLVIWTCKSLESYETLGSLLLSGFCGNQAVTLSYVWVSINLKATGIGFFFLPFGVWILLNSRGWFEILAAGRDLA